MTDITNDAADAPNAARGRLASALAEREEITARIDGFNAAEKRLISAAATDAAAEAELAALDDAASRALSEWAQAGGEGEPPNPDGAKREELLRRTSKAQARARAVEGARAGINAERNAEARTLKSLEARIEPLVLDCLADEAAPVVAEFKRLAAAAGALAWRVVAFKSLAIEMALGAKEEARDQFFARLPTIIESVNGIAPPSTLDDSEGRTHRAAWQALASRLRGGDVEAQLATEA